MSEPLPKEKTVLEWSQNISWGSWYYLQSELTRALIQEVAIPRWSQAQVINIRTILPHLGLTSQELNAIGKQVLMEPNTSIQILNQSVIRIDELGIYGNFPNPGQTDYSPDKKIQFLANKPFFYTVHDRSLQLPLYMGILNDPTQN